MIELKIKKLHEDAIVPEYKTTGSAGMDVYANENTHIKVGAFKLIPLGIALEIPEGYEAQVRPRSGLACKKGITVINTPGTIDSDFRGEVKVGLINLGTEDYTILKGDRIAQLIINKIELPYIKVVKELSSTERGDGGFGSTNLNDNGRTV